MRCYVVIYGAGTMLVLSSYKSSTHPDLVSRFKGSDVSKIILLEVPQELAKERYGEKFERLASQLGKEEFRILDINGASVFNRFKFSEMGQPLMVEF